MIKFARGNRVSMMSWIGIALACAASVGCDDKPTETLAPVSSSLAPAQPKTAESKKLVVDAASSQVTFLMDAPLEKIHGDAPKSASGELFVDPTDTTKTTGLIKIDLMELVLYQQKRDDEKSDYGTKKKDDTQNEHMRTWLEISPDTPENVREENRWVEFKIEKVDEASVKNLTEVKGDERIMTATVSGELRLHGRSAKKQAKIEVKFQFKDDKIAGVTVKTLEPVKVGLEEHEVKPREAFGKLAQKTLGALGSKVATEAPVLIEFSATVAP